MKEKTYHVCLMIQRPNQSSVTYIDGVFTSDKDFMIQEEYAHLKDWLGKDLSPPCKGKDLTLLSLTVIG